MRPEKGSSSDERPGMDVPSSSGSQGTPLVIDALNFLTSFFMPIDAAAAARASPWALVSALEARTKGFLRACRASGLSPHFVIDAGTGTDEAKAKWMARRRKEVRSEERRVPLGADNLLAAVLREHGAPVYQVHGVDGDDVVARLAYELGPKSVILSADRDMFRYDAFIADAPARVMADFAFVKCERGGERIALTASRTPTPKPGVRQRGLDEMPAYEPSRWSEPFNKLRTGQGYTRGACSPLTRRHGNLHGISRPLRTAAYWAMGLRGAVFEMFPEWDEDAGDVRWERGEVMPSDACVHLLKDPNTALEWLVAMDPATAEKTSRKGEKGHGADDGGGEDPYTGTGPDSFRGFARFAIVAEIFAAMNGDTTLLSQLRSLCGGRLGGSDAGAAEGAQRGGSSRDRRGRGGCGVETWIDVWPPLDRIEVQCATRGCDVGFTVSAGERKFLASKGWTVPKRCRDCRCRNKPKRTSEHSPSPLDNAFNTAPVVPSKGRNGGEREGKKTEHVFGRPGGRQDIEVFRMMPPRTLRPSPSQPTPPWCIPDPEVIELAKKMSALK